MDGTLSPDILIDYHFGTLEGAARADVEAALLASPDNLRVYLRLKRELDGPADPARAGLDVPSPAAKAQLFAAVAREIRSPRPQARGLRALAAVFRRPVPLYQTLVVAAAAAVLVWVGALARGPAADEPAHVSHTARGPAVDFARPNPLGLDVF